MQERGVARGLAALYSSPHSSLRATVFDSGEWNFTARRMSPFGRAQVRTSPAEVTISGYRLGYQEGRPGVAQFAIRG
jgi:hypothetical protein